MSRASETVFELLEGVDFKVKRGDFSAFKMKFPLVRGVAWDATTAQLVLVAEDDDDEAVADTWKQMLFGAAGLRYQLRDGEPSALGAPLVLAVVDREREQLLRTLAEQVVRDYAIFARVDLNIVKYEDVDDPELLRDALAPLLPRCREALKAKGGPRQISKDEVRKFWGTLRSRIQSTAEKLDPAFGEFRSAAGSAAADALIDDLDQRPELDAPEPVWRAELDHFRSFGDGKPAFAPVTVIHGANGSGKSAVLEGLELLWAGTSQRKPWDVTAAEYQRHLPYDGDGDFAISGEGFETVDAVASEPRADLTRCVLTQEQISALVSTPPGERHQQMLATTGLEVPELDQRTDALLLEAKQKVDDALAAAGLPPLPTKGSNALSHLRKYLCTKFADQLPQTEELIGLERLLVDVSRGSFSLRDWPDGSKAAEAVSAADGVLVRMPAEIEDLSALETAEEAMEELATSRREVSRRARLLGDSIAAVDAPPVRAALEPERGDRGKKSRELPDEVLPRGLPARWLGHARSLVETAASYEDAADEVEDPRWKKRLRAYAQALREAAAKAPEKDLERLQLGSADGLSPEPESSVGANRRFAEAGFSSPVAQGREFVEALAAYTDALERQAAQLEAIAGAFRHHPARRFGEHASRVMSAACGYEIARKLRKKTGGPIKEASQAEVEDLLQGVLAPIVRELLAALVRFEWYFKPLAIPKRDGELVFGGISTTKPDLDARMVLNSAERNMLGLAWFLALHLLQPEDRRRVLAIDDASAALDPANQAGFVGTIRAFVRLARPEQVVLISHNDLLATSLAMELAPVDGWPESVARLRCSRDDKDLSVIGTEERYQESRALADELERLGLIGMSVSAG